jgi:Zn-dependent alcohol dehydrogenase
MKAAVVRDVGKVQVEEIDQPLFGDNHVLVRLAATGLCHTDITVLNGLYPVPMPVVLGHEGAGVVEAVGDSVSGIGPGDHVVLSITDGCGRCFQCQNGALGLCEEASPRALGGALADGSVLLRKGDEQIHHFLFQSSFAEYAIVSASSAIPIRKDISLEVASLLGCGVSTGYGAVVRRAMVRPGETVLVIGLGGVGLAVVMAARAAGAGTIVAADLSPAACDLAGSVGATHVVHAGDDVDLASEVHSVVPRGVDHAFDAVGNATTIAQSIASVRFGGQAIAIGLNDLSAVASVSLFELIYEKRLTGTYNGSIRPHIDIPAALELYAGGRLPIDRLITRRYSLDEIGTALDEFGSFAGRAVINH